MATGAGQLAGGSSVSGDSETAGPGVVETSAPPPVVETHQVPPVVETSTSARVVETRASGCSGDASRWRRLPQVLKDLDQWAVAGASKAPMGLDDKGRLRNVSVTRPSEWMPFETACRIAAANEHLVTTCVKDGVTVTKTGLDIGFIISESDPVSCIDLDVKDASTHPDKPELWTTPDDFQLYTNIVHHFDSYTERSRSGKGLHIWIEGKIGRGFKRGGIEVYSQERFIISTGDVWVSKPVAAREMMLKNMVSQMRPTAAVTTLVEYPADADDWYVYGVAATAANSEKFLALWRGDWSGQGYPSQSEADLSLMSMLAFYSPSNEQCRRMFRDSGLGKREKTTKSDYHVNRLLSMVRTRQEREANVEFSAIMKASENAQKGAAAEIARLQGGASAQPMLQTPFGVQAPRVVTPLMVPGQGEPVEPTPQADAELAQIAPVSGAAQMAGETGLQWPPGFLGALARFMYSAAFLPIKEVSIVAALGLMAGVTGKAWHIPKSGLNLYIILVARSAIGKEGMHDGVSTMVNACLQRYGPFTNFVDFTEYASGPALIKACLGNPSFVNVSGEWGRRLKRIAMEDGRDGPLASLRTQMTNLYQKSGPNSIAGGMGYSNQENNVASISGVAYSMIGETTPGTFYESLTEGMMEDGFLSRFLIVGYDGGRPKQNQEIIERPDDALRDHVVNIAAQAHRLITANDSQLITRTEEAAAIIKAFSDETDSHLEHLEDEGRRQMWNRATLKALRIAGILAVCDHYTVPIIRAEHINWAIDMVRRDIAMMRKRMSSGDVGDGDLSRQKKLMSIIRDYRDRRGEMPASYKITPAMRANAIVGRHYLQARIGQAASFYKHKFGISKALEETLTQCIANGWLMEVKSDKLIEGYNYHGKAYRILEVPDYRDEGD